MLNKNDFPKLLFIFPRVFPVVSGMYSKKGNKKPGKRVSDCKISTVAVYAGPFFTMLLTVDSF